MSYPIPANEAKRLEALYRYSLLDTPAVQSFDDFAKLAAFICATPIASVTLIDATRLWFKAKFGFDVPEVPREVGFCGTALVAERMLVIEDAVADERYSSNLFVTGEPHVRFYAGVPLVDCDGFGLGTLCVADTNPRQLDPQQLSALEALARQVVTQCEFRRVSHQLMTALRDLKTLQGLLPICAYCKNVRDDKGYWSKVDEYIAAHSEANFSHGICPCCMQRHFPDEYQALIAEGLI